MTTRNRVVVEAERRKRSAVELISILVLVLPDEEDPDRSRYDGDGDEREQAYRRGEFSFIGVRAEAEIVVDGVIQTITSGGLWGIESDSDDTYIKEIGDHEYTDLRKILKTLGVPTSELPTEVKKNQIEWRV